MKKTVLICGFALFLSASGAANAAELTGSGASFPAPIYAKWTDSYAKATANKVSYQSTGSSAGIKQITAKTVDFGASDMPMKPEELAKAGMLQFPTVIGGIVPVVNVPGVKPGDLKLTGVLLADIFLGKVKKWNDNQIKTLNPGINLPDAVITVVRRSDGSGSSFVFTNYLSKVSPEWKQKIGESAAPQLPTGISAKGNEGVSSIVQRLTGTIGYVEYTYAKQNKLVYTLVQNKAMAWPQPDNSAFAAAAKDADWSHQFYEILTDRPRKDAWPITSATFILMNQKQDKPAQAVEVLKFFDWSYKNGGKMASELNYVPLPEAAVKLVRASWTQLKDASGKSLYTGN